MPNEREHCRRASSTFCLPKIQASSFSLPPSNAELLLNKTAYSWSDHMWRVHNERHNSNRKRRSTSPWHLRDFGVLLFRRHNRTPTYNHLLWDSSESCHPYLTDVTDVDWFQRAFLFLHLSVTVEHFAAIRCMLWTFRNCNFCYFTDGRSTIFTHHSTHMFNMNMNHNTVYGSYILPYKLLANLSQFLLMFCRMRNKIPHKDVDLQEFSFSLYQKIAASTAHNLT